MSVSVSISLVFGGHIYPGPKLNLKYILLISRELKIFYI
jgi:hypothetical protein